MKNRPVYLLLWFSILAPFALSGQMDPYAVPWSIWLHNQDDKKPLANEPLDATLMYKDVDGNTLYSETHTGTTNDQGHFVFKVGRGTPVSGSLNAQLFKSIAKFSYLINLAGGGGQTLEGEEEVCASAKSNAALFACDAGNAFAFGGFIFFPVPVPFGGVICPPDDEDYDYYVPFYRRDPLGILEDRAFMSPLSELVRMREAEHIESGELIDYTSFGLGLGKPVYCGPDPTSIYAMHAIYMPDLHGLRHGVDLRLLRDENTEITTSTLNCQNENDGGYGVRAVASTGMVGYGNTGVVGITYGNNNGVGSYGLVQDAPGMDPDDYKYAVAANAGSFPQTYAGAFFGFTFGTSPFMTMSDGRFKKNVRSTDSALEKIHLLRPATYEYIDDTPYHLADGTQHGFIAQELENVFPELVKEVILPSSLDPDKIGTSPGHRYKAINYEGLIPVLTASVQELDQKVNELEEKLAQMNQLVEELEAMVSKCSKK